MVSDCFVSVTIGFMGYKKWVIIELHKMFRRPTLEHNSQLVVALILLVRLRQLLFVLASTTNFTGAPLLTRLTSPTGWG